MEVLIGLLSLTIQIKRETFLCAIRLKVMCTWKKMSRSIGIRKIFDISPNVGDQLAALDCMQTYMISASLQKLCYHYTKSKWNWT